MTLVSPGVSISVIDESITAGTGPGTVPFILIATAQDKTVPDGSAVAVGTTKANAGKVYTITSQRELLQTFGTPIFQKVSGTALNGIPTNEYGLLAAYSYLGIANRAIIVRADVDMAQLDASTTEPTSIAAVDTYWLDLDKSKFGLFAKETAGPDYNAITPVMVTTGTVSTFPVSGTSTDVVVRVHDSGVDDGKIAFYYYSGGSWLEFIADPYFGNTAHFQDLYPTVPPLATLSPFWVKTSPSYSGSDIVIRRMATTGQWEQLECPLLVDDTAANTYYGTEKTGKIYASYDTGYSLELKQHDGSSWVPFTSYVASTTEPTSGPQDGTLWFNAEVGIDGLQDSTVDILVNNGSGTWMETLLPGYDYNPADLTPVPYSTSVPYVFLQSQDPRDNDGNAKPSSGQLAQGGGAVWVDTDQLDEYPVIYRWRNSTWTLVDTTDQTTPHGILFSDVRVEPVGGNPLLAGATGINNGVNGPDLDFDRPDPDAYPSGMLLWNTRFSTMNVKKFVKNYIPEDVVNPVPTTRDRWVSESGNDVNGKMYAGQYAQKIIIVRALQEQLVENEDLRAEDLFFNLLATPGYPECIDEMLTLNTDRMETGFVVGDVPFTLAATGTDLQNWATNANNAAGNGDLGLVSASKYLGVYYPVGLSTDLDGFDVVVPSSHMALRTIAYNDQVAYQWFAPAGLQRGVVSNAAATGYVSAEGEFIPVRLNQGLRDVLYVNNVNPIRTIPNQGIIVYGQKTRQGFASATDRVNVVRLENYLRYQFDRLAQPFMFEPNDDLTRRNVKDAFDRFMAEMVTLRAVYDFLVVCDTSNNTPGRIDRNELWVDVVIAPTKAVEFIYIPIRIRNTGDDLSI